MPELRQFISDQKVRAMPPELVRDEACVRKCLQNLIEVVDDAGDRDGDLGASIRLLSEAYWNARLSWKQVASILQSGIQYGRLYRYVFKRDTKDIEAAVGSPGENFVQLLAFMAAVRGRETPLGPPPQYCQKGNKYRYRTNRVKGRARITESPIADMYEFNLRFNPDFASAVLELSNDLGMSYWVYEAVRDWFVPCDASFDLEGVKRVRRLDKLTHSILMELCFEHSIGILGVHPFGPDGKEIEVQVQRVRIQRQRTCGPRLVLIPGYYQPTQIRTHEERDFIDLYGCMSGVPRTNPRKSEATKIVRAKLLMKQLIKNKVTPHEAWKEAGYTYWNSDLTIEKHLGAQPVAVHRRDIT